MEASSSKATDGLVPEGLELEDLWSELQALKKLYGLLQKRDVKITNGDSSHECLDEKSRHVLKKLLDCATHQALQSQAKIVCYTPEPPHPLEKAENLELKASGSIEKDEHNPEEFQKCEQDAVQQGKAESVQSSSPPVKATPSQSRNKHEPDTEQKLGRKPCSSVDRESDLVTAKSTKAESAQSSIPHGPKLKLTEHKLGRKPCTSINKGDLTRQNSQRSTAISEKTSAQHHPHRHIRHHDRRSSKPRTRSNTNKRNQNQNQPTAVDVLGQEQKIKSAPDPNEEVKPRQSNVDLLAIMPAEKRARVGPIGLPGQSSRSQTRGVDRIDRELTHSKRGYTNGKMRQKSRPPSRMGSINDRESKSIVLRDQNLIVGHIKERPRPEQRNREGPRSKPPSRLGSLKEGEIKSIDTLRDQNRSVSNSRGRNQAEHRNFGGFPGKPRRMQPIAYSSSSSGTMRSDTSATSSSSRRRFTRMMGPTRPTRPPPPRRMLSRGRNRGMQQKKNKEEEGRLKRFKNKLAVIFHHHHHLHVGGGQHGGSQQIKHRSPWAYIKSAVHHTSAGEGKGREAVAKGPARVAAQRQRGYLYAMLEGLIRHVWGKGRRKKIAGGGGRVKGKKLHWWQRFRRRGGFKVANKKKTPRLRLLGFNRSHSRNTWNNK